MMLWSVMTRSHKPTQAVPFANKVFAKLGSDHKKKRSTLRFVPLAGALRASGTAMVALAASTT